MLSFSGFPFFSGKSINQVTVLIGMPRIVRSTLRHSALAGGFGALPVTFVGLVLRFSRVFCICDCAARSFVAVWKTGSIVYYYSKSSHSV